MAREKRVAKAEERVESFAFGAFTMAGILCSLRLLLRCLCGRSHDPHNGPTTRLMISDNWRVRAHSTTRAGPPPSSPRRDVVGIGSRT